MTARQQPGQRAGLLLAGLRVGALVAQLGLERVELLVIGRQVDAGMVERAQFERGDVEFDLLVIEQAEIGDGCDHASVLSTGIAVR
ncbi:hypothetical protein ACFSTI_20080 [Rhizorhabdus histidinilytica]